MSWDAWERKDLSSIVPLFRATGNSERITPSKRKQKRKAYQSEGLILLVMSVEITSLDRFSPFQFLPAATDANVSLGPTWPGFNVTGVDRAFPRNSFQPT